MILELVVDAIYSTNSINDRLNYLSL